MAYESEWIDNKENFADFDKKNDEEISTTTADNENKSQAAEPTILKNIELFIKKKESYMNFNIPQDKPGIEEIFQTKDDGLIEENKEYIILTMEELNVLEKKWDEEIFGDLFNFLKFLENPLEYSYFTTTFVIFKNNEKSQKIDDWLQKEENLIKKLGLQNKVAHEKYKERDFFKEILNFDSNYKKILDSHIKQIEKIKENLNKIENKNEKIINNLNTKTFPIKTNPDCLKQSAREEKENKELFEERVVSRSFFLYNIVF